MLDLIALNLITALVALFAAAALGIRPLRLFPVAAMLLHVVVIQLIVLLTGLAGRLDMLTWRVLAMAMLIIALTSATAPGIRNELGIILLRARRTARVIGRFRLVSAVSLLAAMTAMLAVVGALVGPYLPDVTNYHLAPPTDWIASTRIADHNWPDPRAWWPAGQGLLAAWWMVPTRSLNFAVCANLHWVTMAFAVSWAWARAMRCSPRVALLAACLVASMPIVWAQAVSGLNDLAIAALVLGSIAPLISRRVRAPHFILSVCFLLTALGIKATALPMAPPILALAAFRCFFRSRIPQLPAPNSQLLFRWLLLLLLCAALGGGWYARNARVWGNPLYPATVTLGPIHLVGDPDIAGKVGRLSTSNLTQTLPELLLHRMWDDEKQVVRADVRRGSGFGLLAAALGSLALILLLITVPASRPPLLTVLAITVLLAAAVEPDDWFGRFFAFLALALSICAAVILPRRPVRRALWFALLALLAVPSIFAGIGTSAPPIIRLYWRDRGLTTVPLNVSAGFAQHTWIIAAADRLPDSKPLLILAPAHAAPVAALHGPQLRRHLFYTDGIPTADELESFHEAGARWLIVAMERPQLDEWDIRLLPLQLRRIEPGVYEIP